MAQISAESVSRVAHAYMQREAGKMTLRQLKSLLRKHGIQGEVSGRGTDWEVEVPDEATMNALEKVMPHGVGLGGYRSGHGSWVLSQNHKPSGDWNDPSSRHHYAAGGNGWQTLRLLVDYDKLIRVHRSLSGADDQSAGLLRDVMDKLGDELDISRGAEEALSRLRQIAESGERWSPELLRNNIFKAANSLNMRLPSGMFASEKDAASRRAASGGILVVKDDVEVIYDPFKSTLEIGMGGEWWGGTVKVGKNVYRHRKERLDEAYRPVTVHVEKVGRNIRFAVGGGFGQGTTVMLGFKR